MDNKFHMDKDEYEAFVKHAMDNLMKDTRNPVDFVDDDADWIIYMAECLMELQERGKTLEEATEILYKTGGLAYNYYVDGKPAKDYAWIVTA